MAGAMVILAKVAGPGLAEASVTRSFYCSRNGRGREVPGVTSWSGVQLCVPGTAGRARRPRLHLFTIPAHGLPSENRADCIFFLRSGAGEGDGLGWGDESGGGEAPARDEAGRAAGNLPHG